jgi:hypothetical protein
MSSKSRVTAFLGLDIGNFASGLDKANGLFAGFKRGLKIGGLGSLGGFLGAGAIIQGFRGIMQAAQDARDQAKDIGTTIDAQTASVAAYADRWDIIKESIRDAAIAALSFFTMTGRALGNKMGTGSSDDEVAALASTRAAQEQNEKAQKETRERQTREMAQAEKEFAELRRTNKLADLPAKEREVAINRELDALFERRSKLLPGSLAARKTEIEIEKKLAEVREARAKVERSPDLDPADLKGRSGFGLSVAEVASQRPAGRRSERERRAAEVMALQSRGKAAEAAGRFDSAKTYRERARSLARSIGFGEVETTVGPMRRGGISGSPSMTGVGPAWDDKYGGQLAARNASLNAMYGGAFKRPESFESANAEKSADDLLTAAAEKLDEAASALHAALQPVNTPDY